MPNWSIGPVEITGTREAVSSFAKRFISTDWNFMPQRPERHFSRSYSDMTAAEMERRISECFYGCEDHEVTTFSFIASFAWELDGNLIDSASVSRHEELITIGDACKEDGVSVEIHTSEPSNDLEEWIICHANGAPMYGSQNLKGYRCKSCGNIQSLASFEDPSDTECEECGETGFEKTSEEA